MTNLLERLVMCYANTKCLLGSHTKHYYMSWCGGKPFKCTHCGVAGRDT